MEEVGHGTIMYRDFYMAGWSCRNITFDDVRLVRTYMFVYYLLVYLFTLFRLLVCLLFRSHS